MESQAHRLFHSSDSSFSPFCQKHSSIFSDTLLYQGTSPLKWPGRGGLDRTTRGSLGRHSGGSQHVATSLGVTLPRKRSVTCQAEAENGESGKELKSGRKSGVLAKVTYWIRVSFLFHSLQCFAPL